VDTSPLALTCTFMAEDKNGTARNSKAFSATGIDDDIDHSFTFGTNTVNMFLGGFAHFRCSIPPRDAAGFPSHVVGYTVDYE
jgi:hypothetical protein